MASEKFRKKPVIVEASVWYKLGDHPEVIQYPQDAIDHSIQHLCKFCKLPLECHGWVKTLEGGHIVCPKDWIIKGVKGEYYPCKPDIFQQTYEPVSAPPALLTERAKNPFIGGHWDKTNPNLTHINPMEVWDDACDAQFSLDSERIRALEKKMTEKEDVLQRNIEVLRALKDQLVTDHQAEKQAMIEAIEGMNLMLLRFDAGRQSYTEVPLNDVSEWQSFKSEHLNGGVK